MTDRKNYRIISDSATDLSKEDQRSIGVRFVPFKMDIEDQIFVDDDDLNLDEYFYAMKKTKDPIRTACPSPMEFEEALLEAAESDGIFLITISKELSGSYNAAKVAVAAFQEKHPEVPVHLIDSKSASAGQSNIAFMLHDYIQEGLSFEEIAERIEEFVERQSTYFVLESLDNLIKNGRIKKTAGLVVNALNIKPIMKDNGNGEIELFQVNRGFKKSLKKLAEKVIEEAESKTIEIVSIAHVGTLEKAMELKERIMEGSNIRRIHVIETKGLASGYADLGGIVIAF